MATLANAFPLNTFFLTVNPFAVSGNATAPDTRPALSRTDKRGAIALPLKLFESNYSMILLSSSCRGNETSLEYKLVSDIRDFSPDKSGSK